MQGDGPVLHTRAIPRVEGRWAPRSQFLKQAKSEYAKLQ